MYELFDEDLMREDLQPRHIEDLTIAAGAFLRRRRTNLHDFSAEAITNSGKSDLLGLAVSRQPEAGTFTFTQLYDREVSLKEAVRATELEALHREFAEEDGDPFPPNPMTIDQQINWDDTQSNEYLRSTDVFFQDSYVADQSNLEQVWKSGRVLEWGGQMPWVGIYMLLGEAIEFDRK